MLGASSRARSAGVRGSGRYSQSRLGVIRALAVLVCCVGLALSQEAFADDEPRLRADSAKPLQYRESLELKGISGARLVVVTIDLNACLRATHALTTALHHGFLESPPLAPGETRPKESALVEKRPLRVLLGSRSSGVRVRVVKADSESVFAFKIRDSGWSAGFDPASRERNSVVTLLIDDRKKAIGKSAVESLLVHPGSRLRIALVSGLLSSGSNTISIPPGARRTKAIRGTGANIAVNLRKSRFLERLEKYGLSLVGVHFSIIRTLGGIGVHPDVVHRLDGMKVGIVQICPFAKEWKGAKATFRLRGGEVILTTNIAAPHDATEGD